MPTPQTVTMQSTSMATSFFRKAIATTTKMEEVFTEAMAPEDKGLVLVE